MPSQPAITIATLQWRYKEGECHLCVSMVMCYQCLYVQRQVPSKPAITIATLQVLLEIEDLSAVMDEK